MSKEQSTVQCVHGKDHRCRICWPVVTTWVTTTPVQSIARLDYSGIQLRALALASLPMLDQPSTTGRTQRQNDKGDPYRKRASELFGVPESSVSQKQRLFAKSQMFREIYSTKD